MRPASGRSEETSQGLKKVLLRIMTRRLDRMASDSFASCGTDNGKNGPLTVGTSESIWSDVLPRHVRPRL